MGQSWQPNLRLHQMRAKADAIVNDVIAPLKK
jgi:hypothetical protein